MGNRQNLPHSQLTETKPKIKPTTFRKSHQPLLQKKFARPKFADFLGILSGKLTLFRCEETVLGAEEIDYDK
jgi:hypothetical protein